jgi:hypothetical protein
MTVQQPTVPATLPDQAIGDELAHQLLQRDAIGVLEAEFARDILGANLTRIGADEGDDGLPRREADVALFDHFLIRGPCRRSSWRGPLPET